MKIAVITHVSHIKSNSNYFGYAPYIREMNSWFNYVDEVIIVAPLKTKELDVIDECYKHDAIKFSEVKAFQLTSVNTIFKALLNSPKIIWTIYKAMAQADHIHLRCPGNMGLLGAVVQMAFPKKKKTAKYAGNWDPKSRQPWSYKLQKWILSNTLLTKNMQVLVYGEWPNQTKNIKPFFTATYSEAEIKNVECRSKNLELNDKINFLFVGTLAKGKQPLYAIQLVEQLNQSGKHVNLEMYGEGTLRTTLENYITTHNLQEYVTLKGNQSKETIKAAYQNSHFLILPSKSEGWPKAVAEAMFWGCVPLVTPVSCLPYMVDFGNRGVLLEEKLEKDSTTIVQLIKDVKAYELKSKAAQNWSQHYTTNLFEEEIKKLVQV